MCVYEWGLVDMNGSDLRAWRRANGLRQSDLAGKLGVTQGAVSRWEAGLDEPSVTIMKRLQSIIRDHASHEISLHKFFVETSPAVGVLLDLDGMRLIATSAAHRRVWPDFQQHVGKSLQDDLVETSQKIALDSELRYAAAEGELVQVRGIATAHTHLSPGTEIHHSWQANVRKAGSATLIEILYGFDLDQHDDDIIITRISDIVPHWR